jgi:hypothetical protein
MPDEPRLREAARAAILGGKLPTKKPDRTWGGPGLGNACAVCDRPIIKDELEIEIQFAPAVAGLEPERHHLHIRCFAAWEFERTKV